jgi:hypothetical protein
MADWNRPTLTDLYTDVLTTHLAGKDVDAVTLISNTAIVSNLPVGAMRYDRTNDLFAEWNGSSFVTVPISIAGGGTGASSAAGARGALGLGTMATQDSNAVSITGGSISGISLDASTIGSGVIALARGGTSAALGLGANGSVLQSNGSSVVFGTNGAALTNLNGSNVTAGVVPIEHLPPYPVVPAPPVIPPQRLLQVGQRVDQTAQGITPNNTWQAIGNGYVALYCSATSSRVLLRITIQVYMSTQGSAGRVDLSSRVTRNGAVISTWESVAAYTCLVQPASYWLYTIPFEFLDSPASTAQTVYQLQLKANTVSGSPVVMVNNTSGTTSIYTVEEIGP